jgi:uncharacterized protein (TIGR02391 family)
LREDAEQFSALIRRWNQELCRTERLVENYCHAAFEAAKSVAEKLRQKRGSIPTNLNWSRILGISKAGCPRVAFNSLTTESDRNKQSSLANLIKGLFGAFRNSTAHAPKISLEYHRAGRARHSALSVG